MNENMQRSSTAKLSTGLMSINSTATISAELENTRYSKDVFLQLDTENSHLEILVTVTTRWCWFSSFSIPHL